MPALYLPSMWGHFNGVNNFSSGSLMDPQQPFPPLAGPHTACCPPPMLFFLPSFSSSTLFSLFWVSSQEGLKSSFPNKARIVETTLSRCTWNSQDVKICIVLGPPCHFLAPSLPLFVSLPHSPCPLPSSPQWPVEVTSMAHMKRCKEHSLENKCVWHPPPLLRDYKTMLSACADSMVHCEEHLARAWPLQACHVFLQFTFLPIHPHSWFYHLHNS